MPNSINIPTPRVLAGDAEAKIGQMHSYLFQLAEQLALILNSIDAGAGAAAQPAVQSSSADIYGIQSALKQQIVDTAAALRQEMDEGDGALGESISSLSSSVSALQGNVSSLQSSVSALNQTADDLQDDINAISLTSLGLRRGIATATTAIKGGEYTDIAVSFAALGSVPVVVAGLIGSGDDGAYGGNVNCRVLTGTITTTGFTVRVASGTGQETAQSYSVSWIAAG